MAPSETPRIRAQIPRLYGLAFFVAFAISVVMLATDKNLQTDFGTISGGYYAHWYGVLAMAAADLVAALVLLVRPARIWLKWGVVGSGLFAVALVGVIFTYAQVGFASPSDFANYLFGVTYYGGDIRYLYDALLATYLGTFAVGVVGLFLTRDSGAKAAPIDSGQPASM